MHAVFEVSDAYIAPFPIHNYLPVWREKRWPKLGANNDFDVTFATGCAPCPSGEELQDSSTCVCQPIGMVITWFPECLDVTNLLAEMS